MAAGAFYGAVFFLTIAFDLAGSTPEDRRKAFSDVGSKGSRGMFAPRMYYDEWTPLGHGDPLKHDPTYDYVPPLLDHVHYWEDPRRSPEPSINSRKDPPDEPQALPQVPPTMLVPPPLPIDLAPTSRPPTTVEVEPLNMVHHSTTTGTRFSTAPTLQTKDRPYTQNSLYHQPVQKPKKPPVSIPIQQGQPFRLPQATPKPVKKVEDKESLASLLQSLLDDAPTTFEPMRYTTTEAGRYTPTVPPVATTTPPPSTTERAFSHFMAPAVPETAPMYLIIQGHSKVKTYGASKAPSMHDIPYNQLVGDLKTKVRFSREAESK